MINTLMRKRNRESVVRASLGGDDVNSCKLKDKHPELCSEIRKLQRKLKELEQK